MPRELYPHLVEADLLVIAPLTANTLAKLAHGLADNVLTQAALAFRGPVLAAPAMNVRMWEHPATQENAAPLARARRRADRPRGGRARRGRDGPRPHDGAGGDLRPLPRAARAAPARSPARACSSPPGGTREPLDAVRYPRQPLVRAHGRRARRGGAPAWRGGDAARGEPRRAGARRGRGRRDADGGAMAREALARATDADVVAHGRRRRGLPAGGGARPTSARRTTATGRSSSSRRRTCSPSSAGTARTARCSSASPPTRAHEGLERARAKLAAKAVDLIVFNDIGRDDIGFDAADNEVVIVSAARRARGREGAEVADRRRRCSTRSSSCSRERRLRRLPGGPAAAAQRARRRRRPCRSRGRGAASLTRRRSARRSASRTSASDATPRRRRSSAPCSSSRPSTTMRTTRSAAASSSSGRDVEAQGHYKLARSLRPGERAVRSPRPRRVRAVVQRVSHAPAHAGWRDRPRRCVLLGVARDDDVAAAERLAGKVARLRIFENDEGKLRPLAARLGGAALVVSQFTLIADTAKGNRPSFSRRGSARAGGAALRAFCAALGELGVPGRARRLRRAHGGRARQRRPGDDRPRVLSDRPTHRRAGAGSPQRRSDRATRQ